MAHIPARLVALGGIVVVRKMAVSLFVVAISGFGIFYLESMVMQ
jgi:hypothetical protein